MPNYVKNIVRCEKLELVKKYYVDDKGKFTFNNVIPKPSWMSDDPISDEHPTEIENWYEWSCRHWGTKWDACYPEFCKDECGQEYLEFDTAWSIPENIFREMSKQLNCNIEVDYCEETGDFCGSVEYEPYGFGTCSTPDDSTSFYEKMWGADE